MLISCSYKKLKIEIMEINDYVTQLVHTRQAIHLYPNMKQQIAVKTVTNDSQYSFSNYCKTTYQSKHNVFCHAI